MTSIPQTFVNHAGHCAGHCRAQRFAMDSHCAAAFEAEKAAITSYEDGWDRWDGPVWPWRHTNVPAAAAQEKMENEWAGCCEREAVSEEREVGESRPTTSKPTNIEIKRPVLPRNNSTVSNASEVSNVSLWTSGSVSPCEHCGRRLGDTAQKGEREAQAHL